MKRLITLQTSLLIAIAPVFAQIERMDALKADPSLANFITEAASL